MCAGEQSVKAMLHGTSPSGQVSPQSPAGPVVHDMSADLTDEVSDHRHRFVASTDYLGAATCIDGNGVLFRTSSTVLSTSGLDDERRAAVSVLT